MFKADYSQNVTYWNAPTTDGWGAKSFSAPTIFKGRWEQIAEKYLNFSGELVLSKAVVFVPVEVSLGGYLFLGSSRESSPLLVPGAFEIGMIYKTPDFRGMFTEIKVML